MTIRMLVAGMAAMFLVVGCSGNDGDGEARPGNQDQAILRLFDPAGGDDLARSALPDLADLPGTGWEVTARDEFDDDEEDAPFDQLPSCQHLTDLAFSGPGWMDSGGDGKQPAGRAQIEFSRTIRGGTIPTSLEVEIEITETVAETQSGWPIARAMLTSEETRRCFEDLFAFAMAEEEDTSQFTIEMLSLDPLAVAPHDGASLAFGMKMSMNRVELFNARFEMHLWPYSNASVSVLLFGEATRLTADQVSEILATVDRRVMAAGIEQ